MVTITVRVAVGKGIGRLVCRVNAPRCVNWRAECPAVFAPRACTSRISRRCCNFKLEHYIFNFRTFYRLYYGGIESLLNYLSFESKYMLSGCLLYVRYALHNIRKICKCGKIRLPTI